MKRIPAAAWIAACLLLAGCGEPEAVLPAAAPAPEAQDAASSSRLDAALAGLTPEDVAARWARTCGLCHANGNGGAPLLGDEAAWRPRLAEGEARLLVRTLEGYGAMPPLGYCMDCTEADFRALIRFMLPATLRSEDIRG
jgi:cytochrome c5